MNRLTARRSTPGPHRLMRASAALLLALLAAACGPGVGGSGTGAVPDPVAAQGAAPEALCASALATALGCAPPAASPGAAPVLATTLVLADTDSSGARRLQAVISGEALLFDSACPRLQFEGRWGRGPDGLLRFYGRLADGPLASATLQLDAAGWLLSLHDGAGQQLLAPQRLVPVDGIAPLAGCG